jgi:cobalamin biosynthesis Mg chelatase CobN
MIVGMRHQQARKPGRPVFALMSVIALLALACLPAVAQAEGSAGVQYSDSIPKAEGENAPSHDHQTPAKSSSTGKNGGAPAAGGTTGSQGSNDSMEGSGRDGSSKEGGVPAAGKGGGGSGQGNPAGSANNPSGSGVQPGAQAKGATSQSDDGGSSPLIPILIAILALAAISLGVVWFRQRRQSGSGSATPPASQKAS